MKKHPVRGPRARTRPGEQTRQRRKVLHSKSTEVVQAPKRQADAKPRKSRSSSPRHKRSHEAPSSADFRDTPDESRGGHRPVRDSARELSPRVISKPVVKRSHSQHPTTKDKKKDAGVKDQMVKVQTSPKKRPMTKTPASTSTPPPQDEGIEVQTMVSSGGKRIDRILTCEKSKKAAQDELSKAYKMHVEVSTRTVQRGKHRMIVPRITVFRQKPKAKPSISPTRVRQSKKRSTDKQRKTKQEMRKKAAKREVARQALPKKISKKEDKGQKKEDSTQEGRTKSSTISSSTKKGMSWMKKKMPFFARKKPQSTRETEEASRVIIRPESYYDEDQETSNTRRAVVDEVIKPASGRRSKERTPVIELTPRRTSQQRDGPSINGNSALVRTFEDCFGGECALKQMAADKELRKPKGDFAVISSKPAFQQAESKPKVEEEVAVNTVEKTSPSARTPKRSASPVEGEKEEIDDEKTETRIVLAGALATMGSPAASVARAPATMGLPVARTPATQGNNESWFSTTGMVSSIGLALSTFLAPSAIGDSEEKDKTADTEAPSTDTATNNSSGNVKAGDINEIEKRKLIKTIRAEIAAKKRKRETNSKAVIGAPMSRHINLGLDQNHDFGALINLCGETDYNEAVMRATIQRDIRDARIHAVKDSVMVALQTPNVAVRARNFHSDEASKGMDSVSVPATPMRISKKTMPLQTKSMGGPKPQSSASSVHLAPAHANKRRPREFEEEEDDDDDYADYEVDEVDDLTEASSASASFEVIDDEEDDDEEEGVDRSVADDEAETSEDDESHGSVSVDDSESLDPSTHYEDEDHEFEVISVFELPEIHEDADLENESLSSDGDSGATQSDEDDEESEDLATVDEEKDENDGDDKVDEEDSDDNDDVEDREYEDDVVDEVENVGMEQEVVGMAEAEESEEDCEETESEEGQAEDSDEISEVEETNKMTGADEASAGSSGSSVHSGSTGKDATEAGGTPSVASEPKGTIPLEPATEPVPQPVQEEARVEEAVKIFREHAGRLGVDERDLLRAVQQSYADAGALEGVSA